MPRCACVLSGRAQGGTGCVGTRLCVCVHVFVRAHVSLCVRVCAGVYVKVGVCA